MNKNREEKQNNGNQKKIDPARRIFYGVALGVGALPVRAEYAGSVGADVFYGKVPDKRQDDERHIDFYGLSEQFQDLYVRLKQYRRVEHSFAGRGAGLVDVQYHGGNECGERPQDVPTDPQRHDVYEQIFIRGRKSDTVFRLVVGRDVRTAILLQVCIEFFGRFHLLLLYVPIRGG